MRTSEFRCLAYTPAALQHAALAVAAARAGADGILDLTFCAEEALVRARENLRAALCVARSEHRFGIRIEAERLADAEPFLTLLAGRAHTVVIRPLRGDLLERHTSTLTGVEQRRILVEVSDSDMLIAVNAIRQQIDGVVASGRECGGWIGGESGFILLQRLLDAGFDVWFRGAAGPRSVAAVRAAGAAGFILDDQLLLMPESPLPPDWRAELESVAAHDTVAAGEAHGAAIRAYAPKRTGTMRDLAAAARRLELAGGDAAARRAEWLRETARVGWGAPATSAWPVGQALDSAARNRDTYRSTADLIDDYLRQSSEWIAVAQQARPFAPGGALASDHHTRFPVVQGPMTRVSDTPEFAHAVAAGGALPLLALALLRRDQVRSLLEATARRLDRQPWGVGLLGFVDPELRAAQIEEIIAQKPPFALIAGGRPNQVVELEAAGIPTYLHVPVPSLLRIFLGDGIRRFVFEGRESGGHVGPLGSLHLWERMVDEILITLPPGEESRTSVLFAGGVHDTRSALMASVIAAPLAARGIRTGVLMGSAYIFTREAVTSSAIVDEYQQQAIACRKTVTLEAAPGQENRCANTNFAQEFNDRRAELLRKGASGDEVRRELDNFTLGRLRLATKGIVREGSRLVSVDVDQQRESGMYMIGEVATLRASVGTIADLHRAVCEESTAVLASIDLESEAADVEREARPSDVAIIGMATLVPGASDLDSFWRNILDAKHSITEVPKDRFDIDRYFDPDPKAPDRTYSKWGGFFEPIVFDPIRYGMPPNLAADLAAAQLLAVELSQRALADAGYATRPFDRENTAVVIAELEHGGELDGQRVTRTRLVELTDTPPRFGDDLATITADSFPGSLGNVTPGRVANVLDLGGANYSTDAACASSLAAIDCAVRELETGRCNMAIAGGVDTGQLANMFINFSKVQALSPTGQPRCFDKNADGIVISEGVSLLVLKRLADAERDGDRIYAVIKSIAASSDGRAKGITAPRAEGQIRALRRAYAAAGIAPSTIGYYEAHGTGTPVGDRTEAESIARVLREDGAAPRSCAIGSVKNLIGHTKTAAGATGILKAALALHHKVLPPQTDVADPVDAIADPQSPLFLLQEPAPWLAPAHHPRRAGVSAFGFGGTNFHAVLEEYGGALTSTDTGAAKWPVELIAIRAAGAMELISSLRRLLDAIDRGAAPALADLAFTCAIESAVTGTHLFAAAVENLAELRTAIDDALASLEKRRLEPLPPYVFAGEVAKLDGKTALLFPGQGAQYVKAARELALYFPEMRDAIERLDPAMRALLYPPARFSDVARNDDEAALTRTDVAQPVIGAIASGYARLMARLGLHVDMTAGHSYGEYAALHFAGVFSDADFFRISAERGRIMSAATGGTMLAVFAVPSAIEPHLAAFPNVVIANHNKPSQTVVSGPRDDIEAFAEVMSAARIRTTRIPVSGAFHSPAMAAGSGALARALEAIEVHPPRLPVYANTTASRYESDPAAIRETLARQLVSRVELVREIEAMYDDGARLFIEVGPERILSNAVGAILATREHVSVALDAQRGSLEGFLRAIVRLLAAGTPLSLAALFHDRDVRKLDMNHLVETTAPAAPKPTSWRVDGARGRRIAGPQPATVPMIRATTADRPEIPAIASLGTPRLPISSSAPAPTPQFAAPQPQFTAPQPTEMMMNEPNAALLQAYLAHQETMRQFLHTQEQVMRMFLGADVPATIAPTMATVFVPPPVAQRAVTAAEPVAEQPASGLRSEIVQPTSPAAAPAEAPARPSPEAWGREDVVARLVTIVSERTGYPRDMIGTSMEIEAELGIDSIRRTEVLDQFVKALPEELGSRARAKLEDLSRAATLDATVALLFDSVKEVARASAPPSPVLSASFGNQDEADGDECPRYIMQGMPVSLAPAAKTSMTGLYVVSGEGPAIERTIELLHERGAAVLHLTSSDCRTAAQIEGLLDAVIRESRTVAGIVHLAPLTPFEMPLDLDRWRKSTAIESKSLFWQLRLCANHGIIPRRIITATLLGGNFGRDHVCGPGSPIGGGNAGMLRTYRIEEQSSIKCLDFDAATNAGDIANCVLAELQSDDEAIEIGYPSGIRTVFEPVAAPLATREPDRSAMPGPGDVVLITGGARGITAEVALSMAAPGMTMVMIGRARLAGQDDTEHDGLESIEALRQTIIEKAQRSGEKKTPAEIEAEFRELLRDREIHRNLARLRSAGVTVDYRSVDVRNAKEFSAAIQDVYAQYGRIDAVIHGAGVIADKLLADKKPEAFELVYDTKVDSMFLLYRHLRPESLKLLVLFTSIAGRFGSRGQIDYAAANEVLNRFAWRIRNEWTSTRVIAINWNPWSGTGLSSDTLNRSFRERGIIPISIANGSAFAIDEILMAPHDDVEVIAGEGPWAAHALAGEPRGAAHE